VRIPTKLSYGLYVLALGLYALSFFMPTFDTLFARPSAEPAVFPGYEAFWFCLAGSLATRWTFGICIWFANPLFWVGLVLWLLKRRHEAGLAAFLALLLGSGTLVFAVFLHSGYYAWLASFALLAGASLVGRHG
jgi:hypothetical protein